MLVFVVNFMLLNYFCQQPTADPWSHTSSSPVDPWHSPVAGGGAVAGAAAVRPGGTASVESWLSRTQSPSAASGSSNEGWLQNGSTPTNGAMNGNIAQVMPADPWLTSKPPPPAIDPWLSKSQPLGDPWQSPNINSNGQTHAPPLADPWTGPSPNMGVNIFSIF